MADEDCSYDPAEASHRALRGARREFERHPSVSTVRGFLEGEGTQLVVQLVTGHGGLDASDATLTVRWYAGEAHDARPEFSFHYSSDIGDFGWHHHPQDHVEGWGHFQERSGPAAEYSYDSYTFDSKNPTRVVWELMPLLISKVESE